MNIPLPTTYRPCVGIMLLNNEGHVFTGQRVNTSTEAWQMPQGGIDGDEDIKKSSFRELEEETGIKQAKVEVISQTTDWLYYDLPNHLLGKVWDGKYKGQKQIWFLMRFLGDDKDINLEAHVPEFNEWKWIKPCNLTNMIVPFKRKLYEEVLETFKDDLS